MQFCLLVCLGCGNRLVSLERDGWLGLEGGRGLKLTLMGKQNGKVKMGGWEH